MQVAESHPDMCIVRVRRNHLVGDAMDESHDGFKKDLFKPLRVHFIGEGGHRCWGGVKEFFQLLVTELLCVLTGLLVTLLLSLLGAEGSPRHHLWSMPRHNCHRRLQGAKDRTWNILRQDTSYMGVAPFLLGLLAFMAWRWTEGLVDSAALQFQDASISLSEGLAKIISDDRWAATFTSYVAPNLRGRRTCLATSGCGCRGSHLPPLPPRFVLSTLQADFHQSRSTLAETVDGL
jgi:hypothetical protein